MKHDRIFCFTPLVSLATFLIEVVLAIWVLYKYRRTRFGILSVFLLLALSAFQISEYILCKTGASVPFWMKVGFIGTAFLPALGLHLVHLINNRQYKILVWVGYVLAILAIMAIFLTNNESFLHECVGRFVAFKVGTLTGKIYFLYYALVIGISFVLLFVNIYKKINTKLNIYTTAAFLVFIVPALVLFFASQVPYSGLPSVMCGFAILAAIILTAKILPLYHQNLTKE